MVARFRKLCCSQTIYRTDYAVESAVRTNIVDVRVGGTVTSHPWARPAGRFASTVAAGVRGYCSVAEYCSSVGLVPYWIAKGVQTNLYTRPREAE